LKYIFKKRKNGCQSIYNYLRHFKGILWILGKIIDSSTNYKKNMQRIQSIETSIPKEYAERIQSIDEEYIKSNNLQNQITLWTLEVLSNNLQNEDGSFESNITFNKQFLNYWTNLYSKKH
jgi:hypothetical protein